jgi:uncharacterized protein (DUF169 family)
MKSRIAHELKLRYQPVAVLFTNAKPEGAVQFEEGKWGCVIAMHTAAAKGKTAAFDRQRHGCPGGAVGLGFGGFKRPNMAEFLSSGGPGTEGEHYWKSPTEAKAFMDALPVQDIPFDYVVFKPLSLLEDDERPELVNFYVNPDQLSALVVLAGYGRTTTDNVVTRMGAGCHTICLIPLEESRKNPPRAVIGMFDITARPYVDADVLSFSVPFSMFEEMEAGVPGSFLECADWGKVRDRIPNV